MANIVLVDDDRDLSWALRKSLCDEGHEVLIANDGTEALAVAQRQRPDLIVLDINMPRMDGLTVCHRLRRDPRLAAVPILFLTVRGATEDRIEGLDEGGDDYLAKPFDLEELKARVRALLRRAPSAPESAAEQEDRRSLEAGAVVLDLRSHEVRVAKKVVPLTPTEFDLLHYFMVSPNEVFSARQLLQQVWGYPPQTGDPSLVRGYIKTLRAKIEPDPTHPAYIRTVPRHGYLFVPDAAV